MSAEKEIKPVPEVEALRYKGTPEKPDIKIFVSHRIDLDSQTVDNPLYIPVRCGAVYDERSEDEINGMLGDDTGDNISEKRMNFCELTVQYWAWKNVKADYYGLCHYRRYLSCAKNKINNDIYGNVMFDNFHDAVKDFCLEDAEFMQENLQEYDLITTTPLNTKVVNADNLIEQYSIAPDLHVEDLEKIYELIEKRCPEYYDSAKEYLNKNLFYPCNLFIMGKELFNTYCEWLFPILFDLEEEIDTTYYSQEGIRSVGHIAERLFGVFVTYQLKNNDLKYKVVQRCVIWNTEGFKYPVPAHKENLIPVLFSCNDYFVPYFAVTLQSLISNSSKDNFYQVFLLNTDISKYSKNLIEKMIESYENITVTFLDISDLTRRNNFVANNHISIDTFYRLYCNEIFKNFEKLLYLDCDLIIKKDIAELYAVDLDGYLLAATRDPDYIGQYNGAIPKMKKYTEEKLNLKDPYSYLQAGVLVFNINLMKETFKGFELVDFAAKGDFEYLDQDALNVKCQGKIKFVEMNWNVLIDCYRMRIDSIIKKAPLQIYEGYMETRKNPYIIHYAGGEKPWNSIFCDYSLDFWQEARKTPFYESILFRMNNGEACAEKLDGRSGVRKFADELLPKGSKRRYFAKKLLPKDSLRWKFFKEIYYIFKPKYHK